MGTWRSGGMYSKYHITKADGTPVDEDAQYFVLRLDEDPNACVAALAYALSVYETNVELARDVVAMVLDHGVLGVYHTTTILTAIGDPDLVSTITQRLTRVQPTSSTK